MSFKSYFFKLLIFGIIVIGILYFIGFFDSKDSSTSKPQISDIETYLPVGDGDVVRHNYYVLGYNEEHEQPSWVYYKPYIAEEGKKFKRTDDFRPDSKVRTGSADPADYLRSGYDRGHLCPAADMSLSSESMSETFLMSNMSPQKPAFNRGIWKRLEEQVRVWARNNKLWIVTGPVFKDILGYIGAENKVSVPGHFYKIIYAPERNKMLGFLLPNGKSDYPFSHYAVSVDSIEKVTGLDFFSNLSDDLENALESQVVYSL